MKRRSRRGGALGLVLAVAALAMLAAFIAANVATFNLRVASKAVSIQRADELAESAVQQALAHLQEDLAFHDAVVVTSEEMGLDPGGKATLTFDDKSSAAYSSNNLLGDHPKGYGRDLPDKTVQLIADAEYAGAKRRLEVIVRLPAYPAAIACDGPISAKNCLVGGFDPKPGDSWIPGQGYNVSEDDLKPGHLVSNDARADSIVLDPRTRVTGDVQSRGSVVLNGADVEGEVRASWGKRAPIPNFDLTAFDPAKSVNTFYKELVDPLPSVKLVGNVRSSGNLYLTGDLTLDNSYLFVDGDLTVRGNLSGQGALVVMGEAKLAGASNLVSSQQIAVLAQNGIDIEGSGSERSVFQGLLFSKGYFKARKLTILGGFVVQGGGDTELVDMTVLHSSVSIRPAFKREAYAVVPRFWVPGPVEVSSDLERDPSGFPYGQWTSQGRNVANVLDINRPDFRRSNWDLNDPATVSVHWVDDKPIFRYEYWGQSDQSGLKQESVHRSWDFPDTESLADFVSKENTSANTANFLNGPIPNRQAYKKYLLTVMDHIEKQKDAETETNFSLDINEFIVPGETLKIAYRKASTVKD